MRKKLLYMEDLLEFFENNNLTNFSSADSGYKLCVQVPATFSVDEDVDDNHRGMMRLKIRIFHLNLNRNGSFVSESAAKDAMPTIKNRPILAYIHQRDDGEWDFEAHNVTVKTDEDGNEYYKYEEKQIGSFSEEEPFFEYDEELDKTYICAYAYISEDYTRACDIIRRKGGTKNSVELSIEELAFNSKEKYLELKKFYVSASTLLGSYDDGTEVSEGMLGSRADIVDFSEANNSVIFNKQDLINEITAEVFSRLDDKLADKNSPYNYGKEDKVTMENENVNVEFENETEEEEIKPVVETESAESEEEDVAEKETVDETAGDTPEVVDDFADDDPDSPDDSVNDSDDPDNPDNPGGSGNDSDSGDNGDDNSGNGQSVSVIEDEDSTGGATPKVVNSLEYSVTVDGVTKTFSVSLAEKISAVENLVNQTYGEADNTYYFCDVYEEPSRYCVMHDFWYGRHYRQEYTVKKDVYSLKGDRVQVYTQYLTQDEINSLEKMKSDFSVMESKLNEYKFNELHAKREAIISSEEYSILKNDKDFKELKEKMDDYSIDELSAKADLIFAKYVKTHKNFSAETKKTNGGKYVYMSTGTDSEKTKLPYGGLFKNYKSN